MFKSSVCLIVLWALSATCAKDWWENGNFYQIYPRSFQDSNGDGVGDLNGITSRVYYLKELGVSGIWLSPIFQSPMADFGYDISDYRQVHHEYGTNEDLKKLAVECGKLNIKLILDFVPNHTSNKHEWFLKSVKKEGKYKDYYVWHPGVVNNATGKRQPPSNWISIFRKSAWKWNDERKEYYLHQFLEEQPDLNYRNPAVVEEMKNVLRFWLDQGISGFRIDAVPYLFETLPDSTTGLYKDEKLSGTCADPDEYCYLIHTETQDLDETYDMIFQWRAVIDEYKTGYSRIIMTEAYTTLENAARFYGTAAVKGSHVPFNFELISHTNRDSTAPDFKKNIDNWLKVVPNGCHANWVMGNHDNLRLASRYGPERADLFNILLKTLPGISVTYNGEELALTDGYVSWEDTVDTPACNTNSSVYQKYSRDPTRTPFQWDDTKNAGFSTANKTWLPVAQNYTLNNVKLQKRKTFSHLKIFQKLNRLRENPTLQDGVLNLKAIDDDLLVYTREIENNKKSDLFVILLNLGKQKKEVNLKTAFRSDLPDLLEIILNSWESPEADGDIVESTKVTAYAGVGTVYLAIR